MWMSDCESENDEDDFSFSEKQDTIRDRSFQVLTLNQAGEFMDRLVKDLNSILGVSFLVSHNFSFMWKVLVMRFNEEAC